MGPVPAEAAVEIRPGAGGELLAEAGGIGGGGPRAVRDLQLRVEPELLADPPGTVRDRLHSRRAVAHQRDSVLGELPVPARQRVT